jgi:hypothetical protein
MIDRKKLLLKRAGIDEIVLDKRSLAEIMNDEIPECKWIRQLYLIHRMGYSSWIELVRDRC